MKFRIVSTILSVSILMSALAGCGIKNIGSSKVSDNFNATGLPIVKEATTIKVWMPMHSNHAAVGLTSVAQTVSAKMLEEKTNVKVDWQCAPNADVNSSFNLMVASGELPDVILFRSGETSNYVRNDLAIELNDLVDKYAPNFKKIMENTLDYKKYAYDNDGKLWSMYSYYPDRNMTALWNFPIMRYDWLEKLGLNAPKTQEDWYQVLKAFKEKDPNGNGRKDEIPFSAKGLGPVNYLMFWPLGISPEFYVENDKVKYGFVEPQFKEGLNYGVKLFNEGLIDPDFLSQDAKQVEQKVLSNIAGSVIGGPHQYSNEFKEQTKSSIPGFNMWTTGNLTNNDGKKYTFDMGANQVFSGFSFYITPKAKEKEVIVRWIDYMFSEEGGTIIQYGKEGETYDLVNNKPVFKKDLLLDPKTGTANTFLRSKYTLGGDGSYGVGFPHYLELPYKENGKWMPADYTMVFGNDKVFDSAYNARSELETSKIIPPVMAYSKEDSERLAQIMADVKKFCEEATAKYITGFESLETYDKKVEQVKKMGIDEAISIVQKAYLNFKKK